MTLTRLGLSVNLRFLPEGHRGVMECSHGVSRPWDRKVTIGAAEERGHRLFQGPFSLNSMPRMAGQPPPCFGH